MGFMENSKRVKKETVDGKVELKRKGLPRTKKPIKLPKFTIIKQSNAVTMMQADYSMMHIRVIIQLIEHLQPIINAEINSSANFAMQNLFEEFKHDTQVIVKIPMKNFGVNTNHYEQLRTALKELASIPVEFETTDNSGREMWGFSGFFTAYMHKEKYNREVHIKIEKDVIKKVLLPLSSGYTQFYKEIALSAKNKYTARIYMIISSWKHKGGFAIRLDKFRKILGLQNKYKIFKDLYRRVIRPAYEDLFEKSDIWFEVKEVYQNVTDIEPITLNFKVIRGTLTDTEKNTLKMQTDNLKNLWERHLSALSKEQITTCLNYVSIDNYRHITEKSIELMQYVGKNALKIQGLQNYCYVSLMKIVCPVIEDKDDDN